ncbi:pyridoxal-phosphate dependent enzyme [Afifella sp. IM 167]|uniref:pyridoxal-phosphate dependent enzyme n=1 Tax=Afifella sp. IM 167 TaxID=2033586 RepID=UPI001CCED97D|nr:pyridoxal-5'-phosphate-dependent protein subunit beta [Afifella sp. IM 167]
MTNLLPRQVLDQAVHDRSLARFAKVGIRLPLIAELAEPAKIPADISEALAGVDPDSPDPLNLFRVHWHNTDDRRALADVPAHIVLPSELTGVKAKIIVALGDRFPMIGAHKVLAAYGCLVPRLVSGQIDLEAQRAVWPSTGNYCRGGVAIARILGCRSVAILPEGMSRERFAWLEKWTSSPDDIMRTPGTESNVKEIYDACNALAKDPKNLILNQFSEFGNYIVHRAVTGRALEKAFNSVKGEGALKARAFVCASGSAGTLGAGDHLKAALGAEIAVVEATECPTLLRNGYGEHNIQGIGDKHVPLIHNVFNTDYVIGVSDESSDRLNLLFASGEGRDYLANRRGIAPELIESLKHLGLSGIANVVASIKLAKYLDLGEEDALLTVATDGAAMYETEGEKTLEEDFGGRFDAVSAGEVFGEHLLGAGTGDLLELTRPERERIFNLGYYTWVEQQGIALSEFDQRRSQAFWDGLMDLVPAWDAMIADFNREAGTL